MKLEFWGIVSERDTLGTDPDRSSQGPLLWEGYATISLDEAKKKAASCNGKYGWTYIAKITVDTEAQENNS